MTAPRMHMRDRARQGCVIAVGFAIVVVAAATAVATVIVLLHFIVKYW